MAFFDLFKKSKKENQESLDMSWLEVDMHSHLIPGIDDGSKTLEESITLIKRLKGYGYRKVITTPHIMSEFYKNTPEIIQIGLSELKHTLSEEGVDIEIHAAAEYYMDEIFLEKVQGGQKLLTISNNYVLVETGFISKPQMLLEILFEMEMQGYKPVLAHPERYQYLVQDKKLVSDLIDRDIYFQMNLLSLTGFYSKQIKTFAELLIDEKKVKLLGTDCHNERYLDMLETLPRTKYLDKLKQLDLLNQQL
ncbi:capsular polysaccharide biosynthesis protein [Rhodonellum psychrophilum GCM71 = DSM 17998]|uniref:protein-tyrosine-phosphatase n=2 Tax=Rhodonellum TaxID=336827 RepID=U5C045_9BACT|nr:MULTISPECIES: CpsB/CapC family capsule biosynthesis tyrosine phosphatase [Rhodonellum]ERM83443.1 capsular polysaccharide biosynthesis protein [Rhodonellum psychrophilum GCM71 = DSM 17998]MDO9552613.1 CpsB/CapC family capsule biosynthesis tyrosine phosphatase [Rhodonellum sp.]SDY44323.1 Tyrosine-protein phosphatase YwqE [Rhodonellum ikkaensis]